ncbi:MAG: amidohydrolase [Deltaproteobacteria bacterium]|nr:amidohydrolase [Deltaproteobacteria bacterium]
MDKMNSVDLILINGKVLTVNQHFDIVEAVAVKNGRITAVGGNDMVKALAGPGTKVIDLAGATMLPGINDAHLHTPFFGATRPPLALDLAFPAAQSIGDIVEAVRRKAAEVKPGEWIRGFGWNQGALKECLEDPSVFPRRSDIDPVSTDNPVILIDFSGHTILVNKKALEIAGLHKGSANPVSGEMERDSQGELTGIFKELGAQALVTSHVPILTREEKKIALLNAISILNSHGVTSFTDAAIGPGGEAYGFGVMSAEFIDIYREFLAEGKLTARVSILLLLGDYGALTYEDLEKGLQTFKVPTDLDREWLQFPGVKIFADGIPLTYTSWMNDDYISGNYGHGVSVIPGKTDQDQHDNLVAMIDLVHSHGFQVGVHATGDRAIDAAVDGFVLAMKNRPGGDPRHYLIHGDFISAETCRRLSAINGGVAMQPTIEAMISDFEPSVVGEQRAAYEWPMRTALDSGVNLTSSSDAPITVPNWILGVENAVLRESLTSGAVSGPEEAITVKEAIRTYTINGAYQDHLEAVKGSIEVGKMADFCIIDQDILSIDPHLIRTTRVLKTIVNGRVVYEG